jgi:hypothetical protein
MNNKESLSDNKNALSNSSKNVTWNDLLAGFLLAVKRSLHWHYFQSFSNLQIDVLVSYSVDTSVLTY